MKKIGFNKKVYRKIVDFMLNIILAAVGRRSAPTNLFGGALESKFYCIIRKVF